MHTRSAPYAGPIRRADGGSSTWSSELGTRISCLLRPQLPHRHLHRLTESRDYLIDLALADHIRRRQHHQITVPSIRLANVRPYDEPGLERRRGERLGDVGRAREGRPGVAVLDELDTGEKPTAPHIADVGPFAQRLELA